MIHKKRFAELIHIGLILAVALSFATPASAEWKEKVLYSFQGGTNDGSVPAGGVVFDKQGNLYGATTGGGSASCAPIGSECGTVFQLSPDGNGRWTKTIIYRFQGEGSQDGSVPTSGLIIDGVGNLYGVTAYGGTGDCFLLGVKAGCGTVYEISPPQQKGGAWTRTILYSFPTSKQGYFPNGDLVFDSAGNLYGATAFGGTKGTTCDSFYGGQCGVVFELSPPKQKGGKWTERVLHNFAGGTDGANPNGGLMVDLKGNVYGTSVTGGSESGECSSGGCGTVFELTPSQKQSQTWRQKLLHVFKDGTDGMRPSAGLTSDSKGRLYGTTFSGGTIFRLTPPPRGLIPWQMTVLYTFNGCESGCDPEGRLVFGSGGRLYGTTYSAQSFAGTVYRLTPGIHGRGAWTLSVLYGFTGPPDGAQPTAGLVFDKAGRLFGTTIHGGSSSNCSFHGCGIVFQTNP
jgi:uncharacterized repeat protein (TIGR03803 family)